MWNKIEESSNEDETLGNSFFTNGLFKISNEEKVNKKYFVSFCAAIQFHPFSEHQKSQNQRKPTKQENHSQCRQKLDLAGG